MSSTFSPHPKRLRSKPKARNHGQSKHLAGGFFSNASAFTIENSNMIDIHDIHGSQIAQTIINRFSTGEAGLGHILSYVCTGAAVDSSERDPPPLCHPGTREQIRNTLATWFQDSDRRRNMMWLTGPAGTGKSAVAQTFAEICISNDRLGGAFFFSRANERDKPNTVVPTLAYQLAIHFPDYRRLLTDRIAYDPTILQKTLRAQFKRLIIEPFSTLQVLGHPVTRAPPLILLDGLDECQGVAAQCEIVEMIGEVVRSKQDLPLLWLVCSRPEPHLKHIFSRPDYGIGCLREELLIDAGTRDDVDLYLRDGFAKLRADFREVVNLHWPSNSQFERISKITSGLFVLASTIMKYLGDPVYANPNARLTSLLEFMFNAHKIGIKNPLKALDLFYSNILSSIADDVLQMTKKVLSYHLVLRASPFGILPVQAFCNLLNINQSDFHAALWRLHSVLEVPSPEDAHNSYLKFYHASFEDYLSNPLRSGKFAIDLDEARTEMTRLCPFSYKIDSASTEPFHNLSQTSREDIIDLLQTRILRFEDTYNILIRANGASAQNILNILQRSLNNPDYLVDDATRQSILVASLRLSIASGLYPQTLKLFDIQWSSVPITAGKSADIFKGKCEGSQVCVKVRRVINNTNFGRTAKVVFHEAVIWNQFTHPNLLPFYGVYHGPDKDLVGLVSPWLVNGNIPQYLRKHPGVRRLPLVRDVLAGLQHLHKHQIAHGDLKADNILVKDGGSACLTGFASASIIGPDGRSEVPSPHRQPVYWFTHDLDEDPGELYPGLSSDVYSLAWTMFEIFTGKNLAQEDPGNQRITRLIRHGAVMIRPAYQKAPELTDDIWEIMQACWSRRPEDRPNIDKVIERIPSDVSSPRQVQSNDRWLWRPKAVWSSEEINSDRGFLMDFFNLD